MSTTHWQHDVAVIGGGPAGATAAGLLAAGGCRVLVLERERFPRFHIGESLLPASNRILTRLGITAEDLSSVSVPKWGASFLTPDGSETGYADFTAARDVPQPGTYQVLRSRFDQLLLERAASLGAEVRQATRVLDAAFDYDGVELSFQEEGRPAYRERVRAIVDASGRSGFLAHRLGLRSPDPTLRKVAIYAHYEGVPRPEGRRAGDIRILSRPDMGWAWFIPLPDGLMSVGVVVDHETHRSRAGEDPETMMDRYLEEVPASRQLLRDAARVSQVQVEADFSYDASAHAGDRWLLAGDAGGFLDPVFSSGVYLAMASGEEAADALEPCLRDGVFSRHRFRAYERRLRKRYRRFRRFAAGFYDPAFRELLYHPAPRFGLFPAVVSALAGNWEFAPMTRARLGVFFGLARLQRHLAIAPRLQQHAALSEVANPPVAPVKRPG